MLFGIFILGWCGYNQKSIFPFSIPLGIGLVLFSYLFVVLTDKTKWVKGKEHYEKFNDGGGGS